MGIVFLFFVISDGIRERDSSVICTEPRPGCKIGPCVFNLCS